MRAFLYSETITIAGHVYTWRPSIASLCRMEVNSGCTITDMMKLLHCNKQDDELLRVLAKQLCVEIPDAALRQCAPEFLRVLLAAMGHAPTHQAGALPALSQPDWRDLFMTYVGVMGRPVAEFWEMTLAEYALALAGFCLRNEMEVAAVGAPATSREVLELMKTFPDHAAAWSTRR